MFKALLILFFLTLPIFSWCQDWYNDPIHYPGAILTKKKGVYRGNVSYKQSDEKLFCLTRNNKLTFEAADITYFQFYDLNKQLNRYFFSILTQDNEFRLFELLLKGNISLYRKSYVSNDAIEHRATTTYIYLGRKINYQLYYEHQGNINKLTNFETDILPIMRDNIDAISNYIVINKLNLKAYKDQLAVIDYYNEMAIK